MSRVTREELALSSLLQFMSSELKSEVCDCEICSILDECAVCFSLFVSDYFLQFRAFYS